MITKKENLYKISKLTRKGYSIKKNDIDSNLLLELRNSLKVKPFTHRDYAQFAEEFYVFSENSSKIYLPRFWAIKNLGLPNTINLVQGIKSNNLKTSLKPFDYQKPMIDKIYNDIITTGGSLLCVGCGRGKCHGKDTPILMYDGTIKMVQDVKKGDKLMGDDSTPRNVLSICSGKEQLYKIKPKRGNSYIVNESHILSLKCSTKNKFGKKGDIFDIKLTDYLKLPKKYNNSPESPLVGYKVPVEFTDKKVDMDPYIIGMWLGNETSVGNISNMKLRKYNLLKNKHIPFEFKCNSRKNRLKLLAGLIDSGGYMKNNMYSITQKNERLMDDIVYLCLSLGFFASKKKNWKRCTNEEDKTKKLYYITSISGFGINEIPVQIDKKKCNLKKLIKNPLNSLITVEKLQVDNYYGFTLDGNHRYLLGDFTVTHNTFMSLYIASKLSYKTLVVVHTSVLLSQWIERINQFLPFSKIGIIRGNKFEIEGKDICIAMLQTLVSPQRKFQKNSFQDFGFLIIDECFPFDSGIITEDGYKLIGTLYEMWIKKKKIPRILSYNQTKQIFEYKKMTYAWRKERTNLIKIEANKKIIKCTPEHKILTSKGYLEANKLKEGDLLMSWNNEFLSYGFTRVNTVTPYIHTGYGRQTKPYVYDIEVQDNHNFIICGNKDKCNIHQGIIVSNCHHMGAPVFSRALPLISTKYMLGLSATPERADRLENVFKWYLGDVGWLEKKRDGFLIVKYIKYQDDNFKEIRRYNNSYDLPKMTELIIKSKIRNNFIVEQAIKFAKNGRQILLLSSRRNHLKVLQKIINHKKKDKTTKKLIKKMFPYNKNIRSKILEYYQFKITTGLYIGQMKPAELNESSKCNIVLGTYSLVSEGTDIPTLNTLIMASPKKSIQQVVGRILRAETGFTPLVIDICDDFSIYSNQGLARQKYYKMQEYHIDTFTKNNDQNIFLNDTKQTEGYKPKKRGRKPKQIKPKKMKIIKKTKCLMEFSDSN